MREFNVTGICVPRKHYMVDITNKLEQIKTLVVKEKYFTINRGRQYGKTTTLSMLRRFLANEYIVISLSFQGKGKEEFSDSDAFCQMLLEMIYKALRLTSVDEAYREEWYNPEVKSFTQLSGHISKMCEGKNLVLMIDEVDQMSNNFVFLSFLGLLRELFLVRDEGVDFTFHSVILAGVYDIRNIKQRLIQEGFHTPAQAETAIFNSPWNIAVNFEVEMSFSALEIETMLKAYELDHQTGMNITKIAEEIYQFTSGYPVLVSSICKYIDEKLNNAWTCTGVRQAVKLVLKEDSPLFQSLIKNLTSNEELSNLVYHLLMVETRLPFNIHDPFVSLGVRYGYFKEVRSRVKIANKIFEICLTNYFINKNLREKILANPIAHADEEGIIANGKFNMQTCLEKFAKYYHQYYSDKDIDFLEREARQLFLLFISPILNGDGFTQIESGIVDGRSMDIVAVYQGKQFIVETKIWRGEKRHGDGYKQLLGYMDKLSLSEGYLLTFDFRQNKQRQQEWINVNNSRKIFDIRV